MDKLHFAKLLSTISDLTKNLLTINLLKYYMLVVQNGWLKVHKKFPLYFEMTKKTCESCCSLLHSVENSDILPLKFSVKSLSGILEVQKLLF